MKNSNLHGSLLTKKPKALEVSEATVSKSIEGLLNTRKLYNDRLNSGQVEVVKKYFNKTSGKWTESRHWMKLCKTGTPDRIFIAGGRAVYVEVKKRNEKPSPEQLARHEELRAAGAVVIVADSVDSFIDQFNELFPDLKFNVRVR